MTVLLFFATIVVIVLVGWAAVWVLSKVTHPPVIDALIWAIVVVVVLTLVVKTLWPGVVDIAVPHF